METDSVLIADPDPALLQNQSCLISSDLPGIAFTACRSSQQTVEKLSFSRYSAVIAASRLIQEDTTSLLQHKRTRHALVPLVLVVDHEDREPARSALLHREAFDIIAKPFDPLEALTSIQTAQWQFPVPWAPDSTRTCSIPVPATQFPGVPGRAGVMDKTLSISDEPIDPRLDAFLIDLAGSVEDWTLERALDRLERMRMEQVWT